MALSVKVFFSQTAYLSRSIVLRQSLHRRMSGRSLILLDRSFREGEIQKRVESQTAQKPPFFPTVTRCVRALSIVEGSYQHRCRRLNSSQIGVSMDINTLRCRHQILDWIDSHNCTCSQCGKNGHWIETSGLVMWHRSELQENQTQARSTNVDSPAFSRQPVHCVPLPFLVHEAKAS